MSIVHIIYDGKTEDINLNDLIPDERRAELGLEEGVDLSSDDVTGEQIKRALVNHYDRPATEFEDLVVEHHKSKDMTIRPNATFGITQT